MNNLSPTEIGDFHQNLHEWYAANGRHELPWRCTNDAYAIYISEVMLQQTQVQTVLERFYHPFMARFPSLQALADAPRDDVLKHWEGLGYYTRAANLHKAAALATPELPKDVEGLQALPGIGRNTAHAIAAFAYHQPVPVMEANVKRVLCRVFALSSPSVDSLWGYAFALLDAAAPFDYNQAMMDIGAMVCTRRKPDCAACPAQAICRGKATPEQYPAATKKKATPRRRARIVVWQAQNGRIIPSPREGAFLHGLYGFAEYPANTETVSLHNHAYHLQHDGELLGEVTQVYSHFRMDAEVWRVFVKDSGNEAMWMDVDELKHLAMSGIDRKTSALCGFLYKTI